MLECITSQQDGAIRITAVGETALPGWLETHPESREWISGGFQGGAWNVCVPANAGRPSGLIVSPLEGPVRLPGR
jgi:hypothetical protein